MRGCHNGEPLRLHGKCRKLLLFDFGVLRTLQVEEVGKLHNDVGEIGEGEVVALRIAVDVAQAIIVAALQQEVTDFGV